MVLKSVPSSGTGVDIEELQWEEAILDFKVRKLFFFCKQDCNKEFSKQNCSEATANL